MGFFPIAFADPPQGRGGAGERRGGLVLRLQGLVKVSSLHDGKGRRLGWRVSKYKPLGVGRFTWVNIHPR